MVDKATPFTFSEAMRGLKVEQGSRQTQDRAVGGWMTLGMTFNPWATGFNKEMCSVNETISHSALWNIPRGNEH
jgi:hypothetical protein